MLHVCQFMLCMDCESEIKIYYYYYYNDCNSYSAHDSDKNNLFTNIFPDSKYYPGNVFSTSSKSLAPGIYFIHLNARSLNSNFKEIDHYLSSLNYKFNIIAISETWVRCDSLC